VPKAYVLDWQIYLTVPNLESQGLTAPGFQSQRIRTGSMAQVVELLPRKKKALT
jgi:hypothetical protein